MGWTKQHIEPSPANADEWDRLLLQPEPISDEIWNDLYPEFQPLLESNKAYNDRVDNRAQRRARIKKLEPLVGNIRTALPPLVRLVRKGSSTATSSTSSPTRDSDIKVEQRFPSICEILTWPIIKSIVDENISPEEVEQKFNEVKDQFEQEVGEWRDRIEQELVDIWNADHKTSGNRGKGKGKGRTTTRTARASVRNARASNSARSGTSTSSSAQLTLPEFIATYSKPDGTTTEDISDLSPNLQLLLRADTMFTNDDFILHRTYPDIVPPAVPLGIVIGGPEELNDGVVSPSRTAGCD
ncbi:hypothetical protein BN14_12291 [Rhizoctonia solani AG-1 IB]|uniref:Uncharacterized protein n=1 Tax=Thanatephorus cucumeris (strain AG1-IB / isolate 7/3/14) TaxID=1108050 RepID=M5CF99_THACB|nr:hypothetical protein BN14_12291 [Rhizoctonia solani AG-1 IB]